MPKMLDRRPLLLAAFALAALGSQAWADDKSARSVSDEISQLSDEELMRGTASGGTVPAVYMRCPAPCSSRESASKWTIWSDADRLTGCDKPMLFDFAIYNRLDDPSTPTKLRVCTIDDSVTAGNSSTLSPSRSGFRKVVNNTQSLQPRPGF